MDLTNATDAQLSEYANAVAAEVQRRNRDQQLKDGAWSLVMDAKNAGYTVGQVRGYLMSVVAQAYGGGTE